MDKTNSTIVIGSVDGVLLNISNLQLLCSTILAGRQPLPMPLPLQPEQVQQQEYLQQEQYPPTQQLQQEHLQQDHMQQQQEHLHQEQDQPTQIRLQPDQLQHGLLQQEQLQQEQLHQAYIQQEQLQQEQLHQEQQQQDQQQYEQDQLQQTQPMQPEPLQQVVYSEQLSNNDGGGSDVYVSTGNDSLDETESQQFVYASGTMVADQPQPQQQQQQQQYSPYEVVDHEVQVDLNSGDGSNGGHQSASPSMSASSPYSYNSTTLDSSSPQQQQLQHQQQPNQQPHLQQMPYIVYQTMSDGGVIHQLIDGSNQLGSNVAAEQQPLQQFNSDSAVHQQWLQTHQAPETLEAQASTSYPSMGGVGQQLLQAQPVYMEDISNVHGCGNVEVVAANSGGDNSAQDSTDGTNSNSIFSYGSNMMG